MSTRWAAWTAVAAFVAAPLAPALAQVVARPAAAEAAATGAGAAAFLSPAPAVLAPALSPTLNPMLSAPADLALAAAPLAALTAPAAAAAAPAVPVPAPEVMAAPGAAPAPQIQVGPAEPAEPRGDSAGAPKAGEDKLVRSLMQGDFDGARDWSRETPAPSKDPHALELPSGKKIPLHRGWDGRRFVYLFPFVRTPVTFVEGEPYVTVYRGIRGRFDPSKASYNWKEEMHGLFGEEEAKDNQFGENVFTTLSPRVAASYLIRGGISFITPKTLTLVQIRLPLRQAYIVKRGKNRFGVLGGADEYLSALENRSYMWFRWHAWLRIWEREIVWNLRELGGSLLDPRYAVRTIEGPVKKNAATGEWSSSDNWYAAAKAVAARARAGAWRPPPIENGP